MAEMTFWDHLDELRKVLFRVIGIWFMLAIGYFIAMPYLFDHVILAPCHNDFIFYDLLRYIGQKFDLTDDFFTQDFHVKLVNINLAAPFFIHLSTAFMLSVVTAIPYLFFEIWRFKKDIRHSRHHRHPKCCRHVNKERSSQVDIDQLHIKLLCEEVIGQIKCFTDMP